MPDNDEYYVRCIHGHTSVLDREQMIRNFGEQIVWEIDARDPVTEDDVIHNRLIRPLPVLARDQCTDCQVVDEVHEGLRTGRL